MGPHSVLFFYPELNKVYKLNKFGINVTCTCMYKKTQIVIRQVLSC